MALAAQAQVSFSGNTHEVFQETPAASTGLNAIYVLYSTTGVSMSYTAQTDRTVTWLQYGSQGGGYATEVTGITTSGRVTTMAQVQGDCGYIIEEGTDRTYIWVTDYSNYYLHLNGLTPLQDGDCNTATLNVSGSGGTIVYYTITGVRKELPRNLSLSYNTLVWDESIPSWLSVDTTEVIESYKSTISLPAPYCNTTFTLSGDRFLEFWGLETEQVTSDTYVTYAVDVKTVATQEKRENDNEKTDESSTLGGSAPADITFTAYPTDAVVFGEWQMSRSSSFDDIELRYSENEHQETFTEEGTTYWRFQAANDDGSCSVESDTYTVSIGTSELVCPNVFSPGVTEGINDVWKVSYRSIIDFHCWIFNRWGNQIIELTDPSQGWDGTYKGKLVKPGVYYYVIQATGSDGKKYKLSGDINILRYSKRGDSYSSGDSSSDSGGTSTDTTE